MHLLSVIVFFLVTRGCGELTYGLCHALWDLRRLHLNEGDIKKSAKGSTGS